MWNKTVRSAVCILLFLFCSAAKGQVPGMHHYTRFDGYPGTVGYHIHQDKKGFIWIGTDNGATCFDGKNFRVIDELTGLRDKEILVALPDPEDRILLVPLLNNISYYQQGRIITANQEPSLDSVFNHDLNSTTIDPVTGEIWLFDDRNVGGVYHFNKGKMERVHIPLTDTFQLVKVIDNKMFIRLLGSRHGPANIWVHDLHTHKYHELPGDYVKELYPHSYITDRGDFMINYLHAQNKINVYHFDPVTREMKYMNTCTVQKKIIEIIVDRNNNLWVTYENGGVGFMGRVNQISPTSRVYSFLENVVVNHAFVDRDDNVWISTRTGGLYFISAKHFANMLCIDGFINRPVAIPGCIAGDGNKVFCIGYQNTALVSIVRAHKFINIPLSKRFDQGVRHIEFMAPDKYILLGNDVAIVQMQPAGREQVRYLSQFFPFKDVSVYDSNSIVMAVSSGAHVLALDSLARKGYKGLKFFGGRTTAVLAVSGSILLGTPNGLFFKKDIAQPIAKVKHPVLGLTHITDIAPVHNALVLVSTSASGLYLFNYLSGWAKRFDAGEEGAVNFIRKIYCERNNVFWLATDKGVKRIQLLSMQANADVRTFTTIDGLPSDDVTDVYVQHDTAYVATAEGLAILPLSDKEAEKETAIYFNTLTTSDSVIYFPGQHVSLTYNQNTFRVGLSAIAYENLGRMHYGYRLEGLDPRWMKTDNPELSFTALPPGDYTLSVYAAGYDGKRHSNPVYLSVSILPRFWQTIWFKVVVFVLLLAFLYLIIYRWVAGRKEKQYREVQQKRRQAELELEAIKAQINPHFIYNCLNGVQFFNYNREYERAEQYLDLFAKLIRNTMKYSRETFIALGEEIAYLNNYLALEQLRFKGKLEYDIEVDKAVDAGLLVPAMLVQPYVENALKHGVLGSGEKGHVEVSFKHKADGHLQIRIEDNGPGLPETERRTDAMGLYLSGTRASTYNHLFNLDIEVNFLNKKNLSPGSHGTIVELIIPHIKYEKTRV